MKYILAVILAITVIVAIAWYTPHLRLLPDAKVEWEVEK